MEELRQSIQQDHLVPNAKLSLASASDLAENILAEVFKFRRRAQVKNQCNQRLCPDCSAPHFSKVLSAVKKRKAVPFVLPAFPGKSPNLEKVLGPLPDYAEWLSLNFLDELNKRIRTFYPPGIDLILCSDGRVFSDVVGMDERNVTAYQTELLKMISDLGIYHIKTFNLDDCFSGQDFSQMRSELMNNYGQPLEALRTKIRNGANRQATFDEIEANSMYCGVTRFLFEDGVFKGQTKSRTTLQKEARCKAYEVIRRSNAWSTLISECFPQAVRLSIHPQLCGSSKLGIRLIGEETWMTPWHGVAVETENGFVLLKRSEAEALNARLIHAPDGRPSHYEMKPCTIPLCPTPLYRTRHGEEL